MSEQLTPMPWLPTPAEPDPKAAAGEEWWVRGDFEIVEAQWQTSGVTTEQQAVAALNGITLDWSPSDTHHVADELLLKFVPPAIAVAYRAARERNGFWYS